MLLDPTIQPDFLNLDCCLFCLDPEMKALVPECVWMLFFCDKYLLSQRHAGIFHLLCP